MHILLFKEQVIGVILPAFRKKNNNTHTKKEKGIKYCLRVGVEVRPHDKAASRMMEE